jgi:hypothetical protein
MLRVRKLRVSFLNPPIPIFQALVLNALVMMSANSTRIKLMCSLTAGKRCWDLRELRKLKRGREKTWHAELFSVGNVTILN